MGGHVLFNEDFRTIPIIQRNIVVWKFDTLKRDNEFKSLMSVQIKVVHCSFKIRLQTPSILHICYTGNIEGVHGVGLRSAF